MMSLWFPFFAPVMGRSDFLGPSRTFSPHPLFFVFYTSVLQWFGFWFLDDETVVFFSSCLLVLFLRSWFIDPHCPVACMTRRFCFCHDFRWSFFFVITSFFFDSPVRLLDKRFVLTVSVSGLLFSPFFWPMFLSVCVPLPLERGWKVVVTIFVL